ncbi:MAG: diguanylate cyclase [Eubacteriales bacterium]|nr:diguanylate cyclase [Eubacteriales bacterium]
MALELIYILCIIADYAVMLCFALKKKQHHQKISRLFRKLIIVLSIAVFLSTFAMVMLFKEIALLLESIHFMSTEWVLIYLLVFLEYYLCYFTFHYFPKDVMNKMLVYMVGNSQNGALCFDANDTCIYVNDVVYSFNDKNVTLEDFEDRYKKLLGVEHFQDAEEQTFVREMHTLDSTRYIELSFSKLYDNRGLYMGAYISGYDKTDDINKLKEQQYRATHDALTDLHNEAYFTEAVLELKKSHPDTIYYLVYTDIKDFKLVNSLFGYETGNDILRRFSTLMKTSLPEEAIVARLVSDHFSICIPKESFAEDQLIQCLIDAQKLQSTSEFQLHIHAGIYEIQPQDEDVSVMCDFAKMAMQTVKNDYNKLYAYHNDILMEKLLKNKQMINELEAAIENQQFVIYLHFCQYFHKGFLLH